MIPIWSKTLSGQMHTPCRNSQGVLGDLAQWQHGGRRVSKRLKYQHPSQANICDIPKMTRVQLSLCSCPHRSDISCLKACLYPDLQKQKTPVPSDWCLAAL